MRRARQVFHAQILGIDAERRQFINAQAKSIGGVRLKPDRSAIRQLDCAWIGETAYATQSAEIVVERLVFLSQDDNMFHIGNRARAIVRLNSQRFSDA